MNQAVKRLFTGLAAFAMVIGTGVSPIAQVLAEETPAPTETPVTTTVPEPTETTVTETPTPSEVPAESVEPTSTPVPSTTPEVVETPTPEVTTSSEQTEVVANSVADDVNNPVIERVELVNNGGEFTTEDTVRINVYAYDADSGIASGYLRLMSRNTGNYTSVSLTKGTAENQYYVEISLTDYLPGEYFVSSVQVTDNNTNISDFDDLHDYNNSEHPYAYFFTVADDLDAGVSSFDFARNGATLENDASFNDLGITVETNEAFGKNAYVELIFTAGTDPNAPYRSFRLNATDGEGRRFENAFSNNSHGPFESGAYKYVLSSIRVCKGLGSYDLTMEGMENNSYTWNYVYEMAENPTFDVTVSSVELSHQGEFVKAGDVIDITVQVEANEPLRQQAFIEFSSAKSDISPNSHDVTLNYDEATGTYRGQWTIEENRYSCEWYVYRVRFNTADYSEWDYVYAPAGYPDYIKVKNGDAYSDPVRDVEIHIFEFDASSWSIKETQRIDATNVGRRESLKDIGLTLPEMTSPMEGMNQIGWTTYENNNYTEESMIPLSGGSITVYAKYDKIPYQGWYMYCDVNGNFATKQYNGLAEKGTTYAGLKELMQSFRPDDMSEKYTLARWVPQENPYYEDDAPLSETYVPYYYLTAAYEDAKMIRLQSEYYDEKGLNKMGVNSPVDMKALMIENPDATYEAILAAAEKL